MIQVVHFIDNSLGSAYFESVATWLPRHEFSSSFVSIAPSGRLQTIAQGAGFGAHSLGQTRRFALPAAAARLRALLRRLGPAVLHTHTFNAGIVAGLACSSDHPLLYTRHHFDPHEGLRRSVHKTIDRLTAWRARLVVAPAEAVRRYVVERDHVPHAKTRVVYNGIEDVPPLPRRPTPGTVLAVGRLHEEKGFDVLIESVASLVHRIPGLRVRIAGEGVQRPRLLSLTARLGLTEHVELLGYRTDIPELLATSSVFCLPSRSEAMPVAVLEAMRAEMPIVGSAVGGVPEELADGAGWLVRPGDPADLATALVEALQSEEQAAVRARAARKRFLARFTAASMVAEYGALYQELGRELGPC
jgi:glycosyltransferase involved in cell wall biosynthesis